MKNFTLRLFVSVLLIAILVAPLSAFANSGVISVYIDGVKLDLDVPPQIVDGRTMVPMRKIFESLGAVVSWDEDTQTVTGQKDETIVNVTIGSKVLFKNTTPVQLDVPPMIVEGRTLVPARAVAEAFGCLVDWSADTKSVIIETNGLFVEKTKLNAVQISERVSPSVFYVEVYDAKRNPVASGSGFFISSSGVAVTNYHVIEDTSFAKIITVNGDKHDVLDVIAFDKKLDIAIIRIDKQSESGKVVSGFPSVSLANSDDIKAGQIVYALGSPKGLQNTISDGIISNVKQLVNDEYFIQTTAPISHGSSGGALVNEYGEVIGITSAGIVDDGAQNLGFAIPINVIKLFDVNAEGVPYSEYNSKSNQFILNVDKNTVNLTVGETAEIMVYAEGKGNWSIYYDIDNDYYVDCEWGDWLKSNENVCPLYITAKNPGKTVVTVYSNVDFKGVDIIVNITGNKAVAVYPSSCTNIPTYTSITGLQQLEYRQFENNDMYAYYFDKIDTVEKYVNYLLSNGYVFYKKVNDDGIMNYYYLTPEKELMLVSLAYKWGQIWIYIPH